MDRLSGVLVAPDRTSPPDELPPPILVEDERALQGLLERLEDASEIAVDTEADSFYRYRERVCLIQITAGDGDYLVDPLRGLDLAPLGKVFANERRKKVFHDGEYDIMILKRDYGFAFGGLFDTCIAAAALGFEARGLAAVVQARFGVQLDKTLQRSDWSQRPLSPRQIDYARLDTHYLLPLMRDLSLELSERGRMAILEGECRRLEALEPPQRAFNPDEYIRLKEARTLDPLQQRVLRELYVWRDQEAHGRDVPPFKVLGNGVLVELARRRPRSLRMLEGVVGLPPKVVRRFGGALIQVVKQAEQLGPLRRPPRLPSRDGNEDFDESQIELHERIKAWRKARGLERGIDSSLVLNRRVLARVAKTRPRNPDDLRATGLLEWQVELFGADLVALISAFEADLKAGRIEFTSRRRGRRRALDEDAQT